MFAAEILLGLGQLHSFGSIFGNLRSENIFVDADGHLKINDFDFALDFIRGGPPKINPNETSELFPVEYLSPEMLTSSFETYSKAYDWWCFGIFLYELLTGETPFYHENIKKTCKMILNDEVQFPDDFSPDAKDLISKLLDKNPQTRLGSSEQGIEEIKKHKFFSSLDWNKVLQKEYTPEWKPQIHEIQLDKNDDEIVYEPLFGAREEPI